MLERKYFLYDQHLYKHTIPIDSYCRKYSENTRVKNLDKYKNQFFKDYIYFMEEKKVEILIANDCFRIFLL